MKVITLSREYGAGGHSVGMKVAEALGIPFYDKDIIREAVKATGFDMDLVKEEGEELSKLEAIMNAISNVSSGYYNDSHEKLEEIQKAVILDFAKKGPCVILGRCADDILLNAGIDCFNVYIYADALHRAKRVSELIGSEDPAVIKRAMLKKDSARHNYYNRFTGKKWGNSSNYHLSLDTGLLGYDKCAEIIVDIARYLG
ncbi:MAG: cytidylate kinase-like family protein [Eubacteriales bacterium]|nr:cytidylate kinase-like family protein [Eubacteriales bacterium]